MLLKDFVKERDRKVRRLALFYILDESKNINIGVFFSKSDLEHDFDDRLRQ